jgi:hypothetical protein
LLYNNDYNHSLNLDKQIAVNAHPGGELILTTLFLDFMLKIELFIVNKLKKEIILLI